MPPFPVEDPLAADYSNRVPVALPQPEKTRFPSASKNWIVALYSKLLALVRWTLAVTTPTQQRPRFRHRRKIYRGRSNSDYPARAARDQPRGCRAGPYGRVGVGGQGAVAVKGH